MLVPPPQKKRMTPLGSALQSTPLSASQKEGRAVKALWSLCWGVFCCLFVWLHKEKSAASLCTNAGLCTGCFVTHTHPSTHPHIPSWVFSLCRNVYSVHIICVAQPIHLFMCCRCEQRQHCFHCFIFYPFRILHLSVLAGLCPLSRLNISSPTYVRSSSCKHIAQSPQPRNFKNVL